MYQRPDEAPSARRIVISGRVQGVGFRPFVYRTARALGLHGWVRNDTGRVVIHAEGQPCTIEAFAQKLFAHAPPLARPQLELSENALPIGATCFDIQSSVEAEEGDVHVPPDLFCCEECIAELRDPSERRYRYAFTNCTQCGPRYTIIKALPYDRPSTSMADYPLCASCKEEYTNPRDRRFHAQPLACPDCGPKLWLNSKASPAWGADALAAAVEYLRAGQIVAVKGVGGYHLLCDAANDDAVNRLRSRKRRPDKPLAVMFPQQGADGLDAMRPCVDFTSDEEEACSRAERPIVLVRRRPNCGLSHLIAPGLSEIGVFLPYSPLHHLLLSDFGGPLIATSGNVSGEPVITDSAEAGSRLADVADAFLHHDRPILRPADDSVVRIVAGASRPIRLGRGMAPVEIELPNALREPTLAVGGHLKASIALGWGRRAVVSPHIGELDSPRGVDVFAQVIRDLQSLYRVAPRRLICDMHPGYESTRWAMAQGLAVAPVLHHAAHASVLGIDHPDVRRWLVFTWDGVGLGDDGELWGGEALLGAPGAWQRVASIRPFHLLGGDHAGREPWRSAAALAWENGSRTIALSDEEFAWSAWRRRMGTAPTSSVGRLFDAAAFFVLGIDHVSYEGQGPMMLESAAGGAADPVRLPLKRDERGIWRTDWAPLLPILRDETIGRRQRAAVFHESLAWMIVDQARAITQTQRFDAVGLAGGVFQNRRLAERAVALLEAEGIRVWLPQTVPANDGGLALGQLMEVLGRDVMANEHD